METQNQAGGVANRGGIEARRPLPARLRARRACATAPEGLFQPFGETAGDIVKMHNVHRNGKVRTHVIDDSDGRKRQVTEDWVPASRDP